MRKLFVIDLDGTLLDDKKEIGDFTVEVMTHVRENGGLICLASGRCQEMMEIYAGRIGGCDYMISCNGALARNMKRNELIYRACMSPEQTEKILDYLFGEKLEFMMYSVAEMYYSEGSERLKRRILDYEVMSGEWGTPQKLHAKPMPADGNYCGYEGTLKIVVYEENQEKLTAFQDFVRKELKGVHNESTGYGLMGTFCESVSKYDAVESVKKDAGISWDEVCVFGDYDNDLSMFDCGKYSVAMGNAVDGVKSKANYHTVSNNEEGVAEFINEHFL